MRLISCPVKRSDMRQERRGEERRGEERRGRGEERRGEERRGEKNFVTNIHVEPRVVLEHKEIHVILRPLQIVLRPAGIGNTVWKRLTSPFLNFSYAEFQQAIWTRSRIKRKTRQVGWLFWQMTREAEQNNDKLAEGGRRESTGDG